ncbi:DNA repair protein RecN [Aequorivita antarctica]|uniref:DNA repair protein RecN n=1 Tax=Aequorivita antarctica TaxID=153266 RepID=A0A5C6YV99_9FLAO|nr:DNA repair protein RecN [Aequorivita antarctica]TXD71488.1 DNA repair protein RecN [Aequorivita antarctica]SRX76042.1 DNA repair protein RecN [Aequorivita antarctica]
MITSLAIKNYALIEDIRVDFNEGLTIITGETGAGKSILLGALALVLGKRVDLSSVKDPSKKCVIEGHFSVKNYGLQNVFDQNDLDYEPQTIIRREILPGGKSRAFVNDTPVALTQLQALAPYLVDVHSQHETLEIVSENFQMEVIDALAGNDALLKSYQLQFADFKTILEKLSVIKLQKENGLKELDYNTFLYSELQQASLKKLNQQELEETYETLNNAEAIQESLSNANKLLDEDQIGSLQTAKEARIILGRIKEFSKTFEDYWLRLNSAIIEMEDISDEVANSAEKIEADPEMLSQVNEKLQTLYKLQQKHSVSTVSELIEIEEQLEEKVNTTLGLDDQIENLEKQKNKLCEAALKTAVELHSKRVEAIPVLKQKLEETLFPLGLPNARFQFELSPSKDFKTNGTDTLQLLFTANKGLAFGPLKKVASGGEMSRIMLAIKAVLAEYKKLPTIVFDEIDTGVSGEIANKMAGIMHQMSKTMQLLSITHLPQIAAKGDHHIKVYKEDRNDITTTHLKILSEEERILEIAQMLGGKNVSEAAIANAKELLN